MSQPGKHYLDNKANDGGPCPLCKTGTMEDTGEELSVFPPIPVLKCGACGCEAMGPRRETRPMRAGA